MSATTQLMTAEELLRLPRGRFRYELVKGELITMSPAGSERGAIIVNLTVLLGQHVKTNSVCVSVLRPASRLRRILTRCVRRI